MKKHYRTIINIIIVIGFIASIFYFGLRLYNFEVNKVDRMKIALDEETAKNKVLREDVDALKQESDKVQNYIEIASRFQLDEMDQEITSNNRKMSQLSEILSHLTDIEVRHGKILSYIKTDQFVLEVDFEGETVEGYTQKVPVPAETSVFVIDTIGPTRVDQAVLIELLSRSNLSSKIPQYETFTFIYVENQLIQIYQGQIELFSNNDQIATYNFTKSDYTYESEKFYYECKITVNGLDDATKEKHNFDTDKISVNYSFDIVPKDKSETFYDFKIDASLDKDITAMHQVPFGNVIKSYGDDAKGSGIDFGNGMPTFAISTGRVNWISLETFNSLKENPDLLKKNIKFDLTWNGGRESIEMPSENVNVIIYD